jgi:hypothetical protein
MTMSGAGRFGTSRHKRIRACLNSNYEKSSCPSDAMFQLEMRKSFFQIDRPGNTDQHESCENKTESPVLGNVQSLFKAAFMNEVCQAPAESSEQRQGY